MWAGLAIATTVVGSSFLYFSKFSKPLPEHANYEIFKKIKSPVHVSHRGGSSYAPQNTMHSFRKSVIEVLKNYLF